jgi:hypothetical protein
MLGVSQRLLSRAAGSFHSSQYDAHTHALFRYKSLVVMLGFKFLYLLGGAWDIQWHMYVGRDSLFIPPHIVATVGYVGALITLLVTIGYETYLAHKGVAVVAARRYGPLSATPTQSVMLLALLMALFAMGFDDWWHRVFGLDAKLWSPPHMLLMIATGVVDGALLVGLVVAGRAIGVNLLRSKAPLFAVILAGALLFDNIKFIMSETVLIGYEAGGIGLIGLLYPMMMGSVAAFCLVLLVKLIGVFWILAPLFITALALQALGMTFAEVGFIILKPVSVIDEFVRQNPQSTIGLCRTFTEANGIPSVGFQQIWATMLSAPAIGLLAFGDRLALLRQRPLLLAPCYALVLTVTCAVWFRFMPAMVNYVTTPLDIALAALIATLGALVCGACALRLARAAFRD